MEHLSFFAIMAPAALADSINPCAFAVMLLLLTTILNKTDDKKKVLLAGLLFALAVFITYFLLGLGVLKLLGNFESLFWLKRVVGIVGLLVALANFKDFFWYGKGFVMEVPMARRPTMMKIIKKTISPLGAFVIGIIISLFLLPCSSGPYLTILGYLGAENQALNTRGYIYLLVYNLIFVAPMVVIALLVGLGYSSAEKIGAFKNKNTRLIHLIVGVLMLGLSIYIIGSNYSLR
ncbi:electron transporter [candidate division SR1 bacterium]|nr:electron transporter [candidate division SR1 bacterium]